MSNCQHKHVTVYTRLVACATYYEPAEYEEWFECSDCGATGDPQDLPEDAEEKDGELPPRGTPHEFYD